jgi:hypothetical protein
LSKSLPNETERHELTRKQTDFIPYLLTHSVDEACRQSGRSKSSVYRWFKQPAFAAALKRAQDDGFRDGITRIRANLNKAVNTLVMLMESEDQQIQIRAAQSCIEYAVKLSHNDELERRIVELEERLKERPWQSH